MDELNRMIGKYKTDFKTPTINEDILNLIEPANSKQEEILEFLKTTVEEQSKKAKSNILFAWVNIILGIINVCLLIWQITKS